MIGIPFNQKYTEALMEVCCSITNRCQPGTLWCYLTWEADIVDSRRKFLIHQIVIAVKNKYRFSNRRWAVEAEVQTGAPIHIMVSYS